MSVRRRNITINTDASYCPETKVAGWATYIVSDFFKLKNSGTIDNVDNSYLAEAYALEHGLSILLSNPIEYGKFVGLYINTDCKSLIDQLAKESGNSTAILNDRIQSIIRKYSITDLDIRHVKAHTTIKKARNVVNNWCDEEAKKQMRIRRGEVKKQNVHY